MKKSIENFVFQIEKDKIYVQENFESSSKLKFSEIIKISEITRIKAQHHQKTNEKSLYKIYIYRQNEVLEISFEKQESVRRLMDVLFLT